MPEYNAFDSLKAGRGRLYPTKKEKRKEQWERIKGYDWATPSHVTIYDGFIKVDGDVVKALQEKLSENNGEPFRYNLNVTVDRNDDKTIRQMNIDYYIPEGQSKRSTPAASSSDEELDFLDDEDLPF